MMNNNYKIDTELLICTIQNKRCIWDASSEEYKNRDSKNNAFKEVAAVVVHDFDMLTEKEQNEAVLLVQKRWKTSRDAYVRDRAKLKKSKSGDAAKTIKKYIYFENLKFLDKTMDLNITESSLTCDQDTCTEDNIEESIIVSQSENDEEIDSTPKTSQTFTRKKRKKKESVDDKLLQFLKDSEDSDRDDHKAFLMSLLPTLRSFDESQTLMFRSEVLRIIMDLKKIQPYNKSSNATNQSLTTLDVPSRTTLRPLTPYKMSSDSAQSSSANDTNRPTLLQLSRTELDEMQFGQYDNGYEAPFL
nr:unnamed protein product [Callosobruchus analis]CAI5837098.1 unnamed protein product [Callosobruchus analis]CAI5837350.1 unnamed protein product [Callosobruchus analis]CAI5841806.1 unnamed protein product [Callosobruchus analis]CAI5845877.1 unnamed protein product [Callosobruchus analis]